jgi:uncharacterized YigZ family protein
MDIFSYRTLQTPAEGVYREKGSKFLAFAYPVATESEVELHLEALRKKYFDARHHCFAYMLGADKARFRAFDDGEPNHSAGDPILGQIRSRNLTNVLLAVVRYFGGVKLGVGGLISAYKAAAEDVLRNATVIEADILKGLTFIYPYHSTPEIMRLIKELELVITQQSFEEQCILKTTYKLKHERKLFEKINLLKAMGHAVEISQ